jgi:hypothetical protein
MPRCMLGSSQDTFDSYRSEHCSGIQHGADRLELDSRNTNAAEVYYLVLTLGSRSLERLDEDLHKRGDHSH